MVARKSAVEAETAAARQSTEKAAPAKKTAAKKDAAQQTAKATEKSEQTEETGPAKKSPAKKSPAKKSTAKTAEHKSTAKKAAKAAKKSPAAKTAPEKKQKKAPAKKAAAKKAAPPAKAAAPEKKPAKKAASATEGAAQTTGADTVAAKKTPVAKAEEAEKVPTARTASSAPAQPGELAVRPGEDPWTPEEVEEARSGLHAEIERLRAEISSSQEALTGLMRDSGDGAGDDDADTGTKNITREHEMALAANARERLYQNERALERLDSGTYGLCENCGKPIGKARMQAFPSATLCVECKQKQERR
jgi:RNA polymerase-binding protein DksA